ncbi:hypothetical protein [Deminuibacter soli]|uniref:hypothetical protein n=1 Tax=Deminuibacter soli TaxID=2291815 RepID=UPI001B8684AE|nr:hypothetical protein [Deminuibacter soli]
MAKAAKKGTAKKNRLGVKNSLVNNINARKKKGASRSKKAGSISGDAYEAMEDNWGKPAPKKTAKKAAVKKKTAKKAAPKKAARKKAAGK